MKEVNPKTSYAIAATYHKGKYGKGRGTLIAESNEKNKSDNTSGGGRSMTNKHSWDIIQVNPSTESGDAQPYQQNRIYDSNGIVPAHSSELSQGSHAIIQRGRGHNKGGEKNICPTITKNSFENNDHYNNIRRLTEIECERLQGFEDNWTQYGNYDGEIKLISKTQRYKQMGNAVTKKMVQIIGNKLLASF